MAWSRTRENGSIECELCSHRCVIDLGQAGACGVRCNRDGTLSLPFHGVLSSRGLDPMEKKPLYHFYPGAMIHSIGFWGCNFTCPFCQNHTISQQIPRSGRFPDSAAQKTTPEELIRRLQAEECRFLAFTYSEPTIHFEYILETASLARKAGIRTVLVTNGNLNAEPAEELLTMIDAANIDLKSFRSDYYTQTLSGDRDTVERFIEIGYRLCHVEVTTLIIPGINDCDTEIDALSQYLAALSPEIPLHLSCYYPAWKCTIPATPTESVLRLAEIAAARLHYVYTGNMRNGRSATFCPCCGALLIERVGYRTALPGLHDGHCRECGSKIAVIT